MSTIVFSHANSFPASTYKVLFKSLRSRGFAVKALDKFGHDARYPVTNNWPQVVQQLLDFVQPVVEKVGEPVWLVGHSLGGFLSVMAAARRPDLARGVVLVDSPLVGGWRSSALGVMKSTQLFGSLSPGAVSKQRRNTWPSVEAAYEHFRHKKAFAQWDDQVLLDYVTYGTCEEDGKRVLNFDRQIETQFYNTVPDNLERLLARHPLKCPVSFIGGRDSMEMKQVGMTLTEKITKGRTMMLDGSHLFPMEKPLATAAAIEAALRNMGH
ncbi:alpha/beta hydrolase [Rhodoferax saidenbachensis]|uniref:Alpha/beta hydrolase n=1 Tax=Rhodoferax saidenbachensis TaxID=1484693 RepID=A0A1P8KC53_9BURK|nr:alpha/beta hydrolase [Rhodoferax saidenbachensis]APW43568.1 alpha/beta hydrolase [Rhodoferax saidenbachensis]